MQANTAYFNSNKFDITEMTALLTLWMTFMIDGLMTTLYQACDWLEEQRTIQLGYLHESNRVYLDPDPQPTVDPDPQPVTIEPVNPDPATKKVNLRVWMKLQDMTYRDLQMMLRDYRDTRGDIECKLNAKRETLEREAQRLGLIA